MAAVASLGSLVLIRMTLAAITDTWKVNGEPSGDDLIDCLRQMDDFYRGANALCWLKSDRRQKADIHHG
jgi:hypothetical protein